MLNFGIKTFSCTSENSRDLTLSWRKALSYRNQSIDFLRKSMDWFLYDNGLRLERVKFCCKALHPRCLRESWIRPWYLWLSYHLTLAWTFFGFHFYLWYFSKFIFSVLHNSFSKPISCHWRLSILPENIWFSDVD